ncbi:MAG: SPOR domain-containing protein [Bauldia sp.]
MARGGLAERLGDHRFFAAESEAVPAIVWGAGAAVAIAAAVVVGVSVAGPTLRTAPDPIKTASILAPTAAPQAKPQDPGVDIAAFDREKARLDTVIRLVMTLQEQAEAAARRVGTIDQNVAAIRMPPDNSSQIETLNTRLADVTQRLSAAESSLGRARADLSTLATATKDLAGTVDALASRRLTELDRTPTASIAPARGETGASETARDVAATPAQIPTPVPLVLAPPTIATVTPRVDKPAPATAGNASPPLALAPAGLPPPLPAQPAPVTPTATGSLATASLASPTGAFPPATRDNAGLAGTTLAGPAPPANPTVRSVSPLAIPQAAPAPAPAAPASAAAAAAAGQNQPAIRPAQVATRSQFGLEIGAGSDEASMLAMWRQLAGRNPALFKGLIPLAVDNTNGFGPAKRLVAGPFADAAAAAAACAKLKAVNIGCRTTNYDGVPLIR